MDGERELRERAIGLLARREHSARELVTKLLRAGAEAAAARAVVGALAADGLQSDERFAESFVRSRLARGQGPLLIARALREHAIDEALVRRHFRGIDWFAVAEAVATRRYRAPAADDRREQARRRRFLAGRGFDHEQVEHALACVEAGR